MKKILNCFPVILLIVLTGYSCKSENDSVKVMTLNIRYDNPGDSINTWKDRASLVCNFVLNEKPDVIGMQEVLWKQYELLDSVLTDYASIGVGREDGVKEGEMSPIFYKKEKYGMVRNITFWLSDTPNIQGSIAWGSSIPRIVTWMELVDKNSHKHFFFFNTHFAHDSDSARRMSSALLLDSLERISSGFPFIVTGDFNMLSSSQEYKLLTGPAESVPLLKDTYTISEKKPTGPAYTFNGFSDKPGTRRVDYIFVRNGMKVMDHSTIIKKGNGVFISDHWPVISNIQIKEN
jgi:endonuclease/exonuclease/phosphatase family metal-dependent hydrolase